MSLNELYQTVKNYIFSAENSNTAPFNVVTPSVQPNDAVPITTNYRPAEKIYEGILSRAEAKELIQQANLDFRIRNGDRKIQGRTLGITIEDVIRDFDFHGEIADADIDDIIGKPVSYKIIESTTPDPYCPIWSADETLTILSGPKAGTSYKGKVII